MAGFLAKWFGPSPEVAMVEAIKMFRERAKAAAAGMVEEVNSKSAGAQAHIERAEKWVRDAGIDTALCRAFQHVQWLPSQARREDFHTKLNFMAFTDVAGDEIRASQHTREIWVQFRWQRHLWRIDLRERPNMVFETYGDMALTVDGQQVFIQHVQMERDPRRWFPAGLEGLILGDGRWVAALIELDQAYDTHSKVGLARWHAESAAEKAGRIRMD
jgi:hypothetical protein